MCACLSVARRNEAIHREARASLPPRPAAPANAPPTIQLQENTPFASFQEGADAGNRSGPDTVELIRIQREGDMPRSRLADALAGLPQGPVPGDSHL